MSSNAEQKHAGWRHGLGKAPEASPFDRRVADVLQSFNTWSFKRAQPTEPDLLAQTVAAMVAEMTAISFVLYWGKGPRTRIGEPDHRCLDFLSSMGARIEKHYPPGAAFTLILTDTHARLNGHAEGTIETYFGDIANAAASHAMQSVRLSTLVNAVSVTRMREEGNNASLLASLETCARRWYRGNGSAREGARTYLAMNRLESAATAARFHGSVFITFNGPDYRALFPSSMPVFYMYSLKRGTAVKPWFMDESGAAYADADARL